MKKILLSLGLLFLFTGCFSCSPPVLPVTSAVVKEALRIRHDLVDGHVLTGGREKTWFFQSDSQIIVLSIDKKIGNIYWVTSVLRATDGSFLVKMKVTYSGNRISTCGLLSIKKLN